MTYFLSLADATTIASTTASTNAFLAVSVAFLFLLTFSKAKWARFSFFFLLPYIVADIAIKSGIRPTNEIEIRILLILKTIFFALTISKMFGVIWESLNLISESRYSSQIPFVTFVDEILNGIFNVILIAIFLCWCDLTANLLV